jgi:hypothetical protein
MNSPVTSTVTFVHPFLLPGMDRSHQPGTFELVTEQHELDVVWVAHRTTITILLPSGAAIEAYPVTRGDLDAALSADAKGKST